MSELQEEIDAISFAEADEMSLSLGVGWRTFLACLAPLLPFAFMCAILPAAIIAGIPFDEIAVRHGLSDSDAISMQSGIESLIALPFLTIFAITAIVTSVRAIVGRRLGALADFKTAMRRLAAMIGTALFLFLVYFGAMFVAALVMAFLYKFGLEALSRVFKTFLYVVATAYFVKLSLVPCSVVIGGTCGTASFAESANLVRGRWWITFAILLVSSIISVMFYIPELAFGFAAECAIAFFDIHNYATRFLAYAVTIALGFAATVFPVAVVSVLYLIRRKKLQQAYADGFSCDSEYSSDDSQY